MFLLRVLALRVCHRGHLSGWVSSFLFLIGNKWKNFKNTHLNGCYKKDKRWWVLASMWRTGNPCAILWEYKLVQLLWKIGWWFLKKLKIEYNSAIPLLGMYLKEMKPVSWRNVCIPIIHGFCLSTCAHTHTHTESITMEYYLAIKKGNPAVCDSMNGHYLRALC